MMHRFILTVVLAVVATLPVVASAQDEIVRCSQYLEMNPADQLAAIDAALAISEGRGSGRRFGADATEAEKRDYMLTACNDPEGSVTVAILDMLGE